MTGKTTRLAILGSTGSIGQQTLDVVRSFPGRFRIIGIAGGRNTELLARQAEEFQPLLVSVAGGAVLPGVGGERSTMEELAAHPDVDLVVMAVSGMVGLGPTMAAIAAGKRIALATKEVLVAAGEFVMAEAKARGARILPIDSEPSAMWQCLHGEDGKIGKLILTASGGPFRRLGAEQLRAVTPQQALDHPTWKMGKKVTIDSATLMNKGFEAIETHWLFDVPFDDIEIVIHPQSIVHSMVEFVDGSVKAQLSPPDMRLPIQYALFHPERPASRLPRLDFAQVGALTFEAPDLDSLPCLKLALEAGRRGGTYPAVLSAADEVAVELFLDGRIGFADIAAVVEGVLEQHQGVQGPSLEDVLAADAWARERAQR
jgi:1-deoxy-D-xylulose-5-phosphate reductoisomerase